MEVNNGGYLPSRSVEVNIYRYSPTLTEVNITWYSEIEEPIKSHEKHYSLVLYILIPDVKVKIESSIEKLEWIQ